MSSEQLTILPADEETDRLRAEVPRVIEAANALQVASSADAVIAAGMLDAIDKRLPKIRAAWKPTIDRINDALREARAAMAALADPLSAARAILNGKLSTWKVEQDRKLREQQAEAQRQLQAQADEAALRQAEALEAEGDTEGAKQVLEDAPQIAAPPVAPKQAAPAGRVYATRWVIATDANGEPLIDVEVLRRERPDLMAPNLKAIGALIRARQRVPGVQYREVTDVRKSAHTTRATDAEEVW